MDCDVVQKRSKLMRRVFLLLSSVLLCLGSAGGPLVGRLYFLHGGKRIWLSSFLQTGGFPVIIIPMLIFYNQRRRQNTVSGDGKATKVFLMEVRLFYLAAVVGILTGFDDYLYSYGLAKLPVSTSALIIASQLGFTAGFAFLLVKQKFTFYSINAVALLTVGAAVLALHASGDRPAGESTKQYVVGFLLTLAAAALYGFVLPLIELTYTKAKAAVTYALVMEIQFVICFFATLVCTVGMAINNDFKVIPREAREYNLGEVKYYTVLIFDAVLWQAFFLGAVGVISCGSSLLSGILIALMLPVTEILAVLFYKETFKAEKGVSLVLSLWGFVSYFYGEIKQSKKNKNKNKNTNKDRSPEIELPVSVSSQ